MRDGRFDATSIAEIAAAADITRSAFYFYFASKERLLERLIETTLAEFIDRRLSDLDARDAPPAERLRRLLHGVAEMWVEHGVVLSAAAELAASVPALFDRIAGVIASGVETLTPSWRSTTGTPTRCARARRSPRCCGWASARSTCSPGATRRRRSTTHSPTGSSSSGFALSASRTSLERDPHECRRDHGQPRGALA